MVTQAKTTGTQEATRHHGMYQDDQVTRHEPARREDDEDTDEFNDDKNQRLEGYDENEFDADDRRNRREAGLADGDAAAHEQPQQKRTPSRRGFAAMDKEKQRAIASKGGKASHGGGRKPSKNR
ncbi:KGG domain-containing protein [Chitinophaga sp. GCM10012297]|uniref:Uncharacterized protein n=1 Tax=Chitinophaga chungangae TaxID=2821488 RepID=A0ABS3YI91_9BACT|nr:KGG domain-containing protein [Chitinophaga chungangae]MBO9154354.1 hypothetical protein [Chitinophaga chungangae]